MTQHEQTVVELRRKYGDDVEIRTNEIRAHSDETMVVEGYASVFDSVYNIGFDEIVDRGAFDKVLDDDVRFFFDHGGTPLARTTNNTLQLKVDETGLHYRAELSDTTAGRDLFAAIQRGDVSQSSFAFVVDRETRDKNGVRHIESVRQLLDCSAVSYPASPATSVVTRNNCADEKKSHKLPHKHLDMELQKMSVSDMRAKRAQLADEFAALGAGIEAEARTATDTETEQLDHLDSEIERIDGYIENRERQARQAKTAARMANTGVSSTSEKRDIARTNERFSLSRAVAHIANGRPLMGAELEWSLEARNEAGRSGLQVQGQIGVPRFALETRDGETDQFAATSAAAADAGGPGFVATAVPQGIGALHQPSFTESLGVQFINATSSLQMPRVATKPGATAETEVSEAADSGMQLDQINLTPTRYSAETMYSKQLLLQGGSQVDGFLSREIINAHNRQIDATTFGLIFAYVATDTASPATTTTGMFHDSDTTFAEDVLFRMESALVASDTDFSNVRFVVGARGLGNVRGLSATGTGGDALYNGQSLMGYALTKSGRVSETASKSTVYMGNFGQGLIGAKFGPLDLLVDPYTAASTAQIKLHTNQWFDVDVRQGGALATSILAAG